jgi:hypothetical protein
MHTGKEVKTMNELIILGVMLEIFAIAFLLYGIVGVIYHKCILHSKKSIWQILGEI